MSTATLVSVKTKRDAHFSSDSPSLNRHLVQWSANRETLDLGAILADRTQVASARQAMAPYRAALGFAAKSAPLLGGNTKLDKADLQSYGVALSPADMSGAWNTCDFATNGCAAACLGDKSGRNIFDDVKRAKVWKTEFLANDPRNFVIALAADIASKVRTHGKVAIRLNVFSDLQWHRFAMELFDYFADSVTFYDYTKRPTKGAYSVASSYSEREVFAGVSPSELARSTAGPVAVVIAQSVDKSEAAAALAGHGVAVVDADTSDEWLMHAEGPTLGLLTFKAARKTDTTENAFVVQSVKALA